MAKIGLRDDGCGTVRTASARVVLADDCPQVAGTDPVPGEGLLDVEGFPLLRVRARQRTGYDDDGAPMFAWSTLLEARAIVWEDRKEFDADAGFTKVTADVAMGNPSGVTVIPESSVVLNVATGTLWQVTSTKIVPDRVEMKLLRIDQSTVVEGV